MLTATHINQSQRRLAVRVRVKVKDTMGREG
jgi:hypothetical protein